MTRAKKQLPPYLRVAVIAASLTMLSAFSKSCGTSVPPLKIETPGHAQATPVFMKAPLKPSKWKPEKFYVGVGDRYEVHLDNKSINSPRYARKVGIRNNSHAIWLTKDFKEYWINRNQIAEMQREGITPLLIFYYFGDDISVENITTNWKKYYRFLVNTASHLSTDKKVLIIFEPEFNLEARNNKSSIYSWPGFNEFIIATVKVLRHYFPKAKIGICPGDFRTHNFRKSIKRGVKYVDFIAFQELWASTRKSNMSEKFEDVSDYALLFTNYLHTTFEKPILLSYIGISSYHQSKGNQNWAIIQSDIIRNFTNKLPVFIQRGLFGILYFELFDDPKHVGYFGIAERNFGLLDFKERPKPALKAFIELSKKVDFTNKITRLKAYNPK